MSVREFKETPHGKTSKNENETTKTRKPKNFQAKRQTKNKGSKDHMFHKITVVQIRRTNSDFIHNQANEKIMMKTEEKREIEAKKRLNTSLVGDLQT